MPMPPIEFHVVMFRGEWDQARSQYVLLFLMEALARVNQSLIRQNHSMIARKMIPESERLPMLYRSGIHYEREVPGQEEWPDYVNMLRKKGQEFPGPWADCEDLACARVAELREQPEHYLDTKGLLILPEELEQLKKGTINGRKIGKKVGGGIKAKPFAKWRRGPTGAFHYHALVQLPDGRLEDPSLVLGMGKEALFAQQNIAERLKAGTLDPKIQFAVPPQVMVVDTESPTGYNDRRKDPKGNTGVPGAAAEFAIKDKSMESIMGAALQSLMPGGSVDADERTRWKDARQRLMRSSTGADEASSPPPPPPPSSSPPASPPATQDAISAIQKQLDELKAKVNPAPEPIITPGGIVKRTVKSEAFRVLNELAKRLFNA